MNKMSLKKELNKLFKAMDYIVDNYLSKRKITSKDSEAFYGIYQQLGLLWEFLGSLCSHRDGYKMENGKFICKICGRVRGVKEKYYLLPRIGEKVIGRIVKPKKGSFKKISKKQAEIINDTIKFHGAKLNVLVSNGYVTKFGKTGKDMNIASDRIVSLKENGITVEINKYIVSMKIDSREKQKYLCGGFLWELPKKALKRAPIILSYSKHGRLMEIELIR